MCASFSGEKNDVSNKVRNLPGLGICVSKGFSRFRARACSTDVELCVLKNVPGMKCPNVNWGAGRRLGRRRRRYVLFARSFGEVVAGWNYDIVDERRQLKFDCEIFEGTVVDGGRAASRTISVERS